MSDGITAVVAVITAILGVAIVAVLVGSNSQTGSVLTSAGTALSGVIQAAVAPASGGSGGIVNNGLVGQNIGGGLGIGTTG